MSSPSKAMRPAVGRSTPVMQLKNVLLPAPLGPMTARISPAPISKLTALSAARPPNLTVSLSTCKIGPSAPRLSGGRWSIVCSTLKLRRGEVAGRRNHLLGRRHRLVQIVGPALHLEDELLQEGLMVFLADVLVTLREVVAQLHLEAFERRDQLHGVLRAVELRFLHRDFHRVESLVVRLHVFVGQRPGRVDLGEPLLCLVEELVMRRSVEWTLEHRDVAIDADEAIDLVAEAGQIARLGDRAIAGKLVLLGEAEIVGLGADGDTVLAEEDREQAVEAAGDFRQERRHVGGAERDAGGADDFTAVLLDLGGVGVTRRLTPGVI